MIVKCSHCKQILSSEDFETHECDLPLKECKRIEVVYFQDESYKDKKLMTGWAIDGVLYTFEVVPRKPIPFVVSSSDDSYHESQNRRKVTRTIINKTYVPRFSHEKWTIWKALEIGNLRKRMNKMQGCRSSNMIEQVEGSWMGS